VRQQFQAIYFCDWSALMEVVATSMRLFLLLLKSPEFLPHLIVVHKQNWWRRNRLLLRSYLLRIAIATFIPDSHLLFLIHAITAISGVAQQNLSSLAITAPIGRRYE
jgi:hypothetical protein